MTALRTPRRRDRGLSPLTPQRKWRAITLASLLLAPAMWALLAGLVTVASDDAQGPQPALAIALGLSLIPFVYMALAFASEHPRAPGATVRAMGMCLVVGIPVSALAGDAVTGLVAGIGSGGAVALRRDDVHDVRTRAWSVVVGAGYTFLLARVAGPVVLLAAPVFPFTGLGLADHYAEWRALRAGEPESADG
jgi:hypothetical protein